LVSQFSLEERPDCYPVSGGPFKNLCSGNDDTIVFTEKAAIQAAIEMLKE